MHKAQKGIGVMFHLKSKVETCLGLVEVSTVDLSLPGWTSGKGYETCLFLPGEESEVVAWYATQEQAAAGHAAFSNEAVLKAITEVMDVRDSYLHQLVKANQTLDKIIEG